MSHPPAVAEKTAPSPKQRSIAEAATRLFMAEGYDAVSMAAIARATGVSKATLYAHFASKEQLFASLVGEACARSGPNSVARLDAGADLRATLTGLAGRGSRFMLEERSLAIHRVVMAGSARFPELGRAYCERGPAVGRRAPGAWIERQMEAGRLRRRDRRRRCRNLPQGLRADRLVERLRSP